MKRSKLIVPILVSVVLMLSISGCGNATGGGGGGASPSIIFVSTTGNDSGTGTSESPFLTISHALSVAKSNTIISIEAGTYIEHLTWPNTKSIILRGAGRDSTILDANKTGRGIYILPPSGSLSKIGIEKMTIKNGHATAGGAGIYFDNPNTTLGLYDVYIHDCSIESSDGAGIDAINTSSKLVVLCCTLESNNAVVTNASGAAAILAACELNLSSCEVFNNHAGNSGSSSAITSSKGGRIENCLVYNNTGGFHGAIYADHNTSSLGITIVNSTIASNEATTSGGGVCLGNGTHKLINCILWGNIAPTDNELRIVSGTVEVTCSDIKGGYTAYAGTGNIDKDPAFNSITDLHLTSSTTTEITDGGTTTNAPKTDFDGNTRSLTTPSMGAYED